MNDNKPKSKARVMHPDEISDLRDRIAISVMNGCLSCDDSYDAKACSEYCYEVADHMLAARAEDVQR